MSLDITFKEIRMMSCPHCGEIVAGEVVSCGIGGGKGWYPFLESVGYCVPHDKLTKENDWYGRDMHLTREQTEELYQFIKKRPNIYGQEAMGVIAKALLDGNIIAINADW